YSAALVNNRRVDARIHDSHEVPDGWDVRHQSSRLDRDTIVTGCQAAEGGPEGAVAQLAALPVGPTSAIERVEPDQEQNLQIPLRHLATDLQWFSRGKKIRDLKSELGPRLGLLCTRGG